MDDIDMTSIMLLLEEENEGKIKKKRKRTCVGPILMNRKKLSVLHT